MEYKVQKCENPGCSCYGQELVDRGYGYPVCPGTPNRTVDDELEELLKTSDELLKKMEHRIKRSKEILGM